MSSRSTTLKLSIVSACLLSAVPGSAAPNVDAPLERAHKLTTRLYTAVTAARTSAESHGKNLGYVPYAEVKELLSAELQKSAEALFDQIAKTPKDEKPEGIEFDYFAGFGSRPKSFQITQVRLWGHQPELEIELTGPADDPHFPNWKHRVWTHWSTEDGKLVLTNVLWPGGSLKGELRDLLKAESQ